MTEIVKTALQPPVLPTSRVPITIRPGTLDDLPFLDSLQKLHTKQVGWMPTAQFEGKINAGHVLVAEEGRIQRAEGRNPDQSLTPDESSSLHPSSLCPHPSPVGYVIGNDQYFKRDDVGIIYQLNVLPIKQRGLIGATLIKAMFDRAAYGCKLFCCWCAQDIEANWFWESLGFVPLAFRAGSRGKRRVHIFWQRRIREGDTTTPWWFPSQTTSGSIREDRIVLPIPPGTHWRDAKPLILPGATDDHPKQLPAPRQKKRKDAQAIKPPHTPQGGLWFVALKASAPEMVKPPREPRRKTKNDPMLIAAARELRDRWLEKVNAGQYVIEAQGKYDVSRTLSGVEGSAAEGSRQIEGIPMTSKEMPLLTAA